MPLVISSPRAIIEFSAVPRRTPLGSVCITLRLFGNGITKAYREHSVNRAPGGALTDHQGKAGRHRRRSRRSRTVSVPARYVPQGLLGHGVAGSGGFRQRLQRLLRLPGSIENGMEPAITPLPAELLRRSHHRSRMTPAAGSPPCRRSPPRGRISRRAAAI